MTNPHPLAALIAGVPRRYDIDPMFDYLREDLVLAALEAAPVPDLVEAEEYEAHLRREGDGLSVGAADTIRALIALATAQAAQIAGLTDALKGCTEDLERHARSEFEGVWLEEDFESLLSPYRAVLEAVQAKEKP